MRERYVLLGLTRARAGWFDSVGRWATSAALPAEFVRCVSAEELRARLRSGRVFSAAIVAADVRGLDRDLVAEAAEVGCAVLVVDDPANGRDWGVIGVAAVLAPVFSRDELLEVLTAHASTVGPATVPEEPEEVTAQPEGGALVAVTGPGGTGASTVAMALAQGLARGRATRRSGRHRAGRTRAAARRSDGRSPAPTVLLADLCRAADQAMLHDARAVVPGLQEVVEAHRVGVPSVGELRDQTFEVPARGYRLLVGLRQHRHWVGLRPRAVEATLASLRRLADVTVADVDADVEGEAETGSVDVAERNLLARSTMVRARVVVVVGEPSTKGLHALVRTLGGLIAFGVPGDRCLPVLNLAPRSPRARAERARALADLMAATAGEDGRRVANPLHLPARRVDGAVRDGVELPAPLPTLAARAVTGMLERVGERRHEPIAPQRLVPGSLQGFTAQDDGPPP